MNNQILDQKMEALVKEILTHLREYYTLLRESSDKPASQAEVPPLSETALKREERLRAWRTEQARTTSLPAYQILTNRTLRELADKAPGTVEALSAIHGVGPKKIERYGREILEVLR